MICLDYDAGIREVDFGFMKDRALLAYFDKEPVSHCHDYGAKPFESAFMM